MQAQIEKPDPFSGPALIRLQQHRCPLLRRYDFFGSFDGLAAGAGLAGGAACATGIIGAAPGRG